MSKLPTFANEEVDALFTAYVIGKLRIRAAAKSIHRDEVAVRKLLFDRGWIRLQPKNHVFRKSRTGYTSPPSAGELAALNSKIFLVGNFTSERALQYVKWFGAGRVFWPHEVAP
jgi:hypothetical protein